MKQYIDTVIDELSNLPVPDAEVFVYNDDATDTTAATLATLYASDGSTEIGNPLTTNAQGEYSFYHEAGEFTALVYYGGRLRRRLRLLVGGGYSVASQTAAAAAQAAAGVGEYADTAAGLAATTLGKTFWVDQGDGTGQVYRHDAGPVATALNSFILDPTATSAATIFAGGVPRSVALASATGATLVGNQLSAGSNLRTQSIAEFVEGGAVMPSQFTGTDEQQLTRAIVEAATARPTIGQTVQLPRGVIEIAVPFNCANRVSVIGVNKRGTVITPSGSWSGAYMATAVNGTTSMFDNALERLTLDCDHVVGLGGIIADAWQEGGGLRNVLIEKFTTNGVYIRNGYGGASTCLINDCEIMGSATVAADAGIYVEEVSALGNFLVHVTNSTITGGGAGFELDYGIYVENDSLFCDAVHFEDATSAIYLDGVGSHVLTGVTGNNTVTNLVEIASTFTGSLKMTGCFRGGATNLIKDNRAGGFGTISYDTEVSIKSNPPLAHGAIVASASIDGSGTPAVTKGFGIASITDNGTGDYTVTLTRSAQNSADFSVFASMNANGWVQCALNGVDSVRVKCFNGSGGAIDVNELKILVVRVA